MSENLFCTKGALVLYLWWLAYLSAFLMISKKYGLVSKVTQIQWGSDRPPRVSKVLSMVKFSKRDISSHSPLIFLSFSKYLHTPTVGTVIE